jgi:choline dehydrogenase-like flavoprotein
MDYDAIVVGSGFGGRLAALRLSEKGYRLAVLEMGRRIAADPGGGVVDLHHEVFGYPGWFVVDGAAIPANVGVDPSLTITALGLISAKRA